MARELGNSAQKWTPSETVSPSLVCHSALVLVSALSSPVQSLCPPFPSHVLSSTRTVVAQRRSDSPAPGSLPAVSAVDAPLAPVVSMSSAVSTSASSAVVSPDQCLPPSLGCWSG